MKYLSKIHNLILPITAISILQWCNPSVEETYNTTNENTFKVINTSTPTPIMRCHPAATKSMEKCYE